MREREYTVDSASVIELAMQSHYTAYDCEYVALAKSLRVPLVTNDAQILRDFPDVARPFVSRPN